MATVDNSLNKPINTTDLTPTSGVTTGQQMNRLSALALSVALAAPSAVMAQPVDPGFSKGPGSHPVASVLLFPIYLGARLQAALQPEKDSCWNKGSVNVAGCNVADRYDNYLD